MGLTTDTVIATKTIDGALQGGANSANTFDLGALVGNSVIVVGTTSINNLGTASQAGVIRSMIFEDSLLLVDGANMILFGGNDIQTEADDIATFIALSTTQWKMISYEKPSGKRDGRVNAAGLANDCVTVSKLNQGVITPSKMMILGEVNLADTATTLLASDLVEKGIFKATPTANRIQITDDAPNIIDALNNVSGYQIGTWFDFTIVNTAAFNETLTAGTGVTLVGNMVVNNNSATFRTLVTSISTVTIYRK